MDFCLAQDNTDSLDLSKMWKKLNVFDYDISQNQI